MFSKPATLALCALLMAGSQAMAPAHAQDGPIGIAFAQAPEQSSGVCTGQNTDAALACAKAKCVQGGALTEDCLRVKWCYPAGWSADVFVQHQEGIHWHEYLCGWDSKEALMAAVAVACDRSLRDYLIECSAVRYWDNEGRELEVE